MAAFPPPARGLVPALALLGLLAGCNLLNPSGEGSPDTAAGWIAEGDKEMQAKDYPAAERAYRKALDLEGTNGLAWDGWLDARAGQAQQATGASTAGLLVETRKLENGNAKPFWSLSLEGQDRYYRYFATLDTAYAACLRASGGARFADPVRQGAWVAVRAGWALLRLCDYDRDGRITAADTAVLRVCRDSPGGLGNSGGLFSFGTADLSRLVQDPATGRPDPARVAELDAWVVEADTVLGVLGLQAKDDAKWAELRTFLDVQGREAPFMPTGDAVDNDGDGCADEEVPDGRDNDGDGFVDEDTRMGYRDATGAFWGAGALALRTTEDAVDTSRLVGTDAVTGRLRTGRDPSRADTVGLRYATGALWAAFPGLLERCRPFVDPTDSGYAAHHWKLVAEWDRASLDSLGLSGKVPLAGDSSGSLLGRPRLSHAQLTDVRLAVLGIADPVRRSLAGARLVGGCWTLRAAAAAGRRQP